MTVLHDLWDDWGWLDPDHNMHTLQPEFQAERARLLTHIHALPEPRLLRDLIRPAAGIVLVMLADLAVLTGFFILVTAWWPW